MTTINLKDFFYWYRTDEFVEVPDEVAEELRADKRYEASYARQIKRHKAGSSLDCNDGAEYFACLHEPAPQDVLEWKELYFHLWNALNSLPEVQGRRVDACIILGKSYRTEAKLEGVGKNAVRGSVSSGLEYMKKYLKKFL